MRNMRPFVFVLVLIVLIAFAMGLSACHEETPPDLEVHLDGTAYRGAELTLNADISSALGKALEESGQKVSFELVEGADACYIYNGKVKIINTAAVGTVISVRVSALEHTQTVSCIVGHTPVSSVTMDAVPTLVAGADYALSATIAPAYADDNAIDYVVVRGGEVANVFDGMLHVSADADASDVIEVAATAGGWVSEPVRVAIGTVQARAVSVEVLDEDGRAADTTLQRKDRVTLWVSVSPAEATVPVTIRKDGDYAAQYIGLERNVLTVSEDAPEGEFSVTVSAGKATRTLAFTVVKTPVEMVVLSRDAEGDYVSYNEIINTQCRVYPAEATYRNVTYTVEDGAEYVEAQSTPGRYRVTTRRAGASIVIRATADGKYRELRLVTVGVQPQSVQLSAEGGTSVRVGESRTLSATISPAECEGTVLYTVEEGGYLCTLEDNVITFVQMEHGNDEVKVRGTVGNVSNVIVFHVVPVPVETVTISTTDNTEGLVSDDVVTFAGVVAPADASYPQLTYRVASGGAFGALAGNVFTVGHNTVFGSVFIEAVSADGVVSNQVELKINADAYSPSFATWSDLDADPHLLDGNSAVYLDLRTLPYNAGDCMVVVSDDVEVLTLRGNYQGTLDTCYKNLYFYFLTTDSVTVYLNGMGIVIDNGFTDAVLDFGSATATLVAENDNYIAAGHAYALSTVGFMIEEDSDNRLMKGMDGFAGQDGGTAVSGYDLTISGSGAMTLVGGDASSGTDATDGLSTELEATYAGNGGWGGNGGEGGYAVYAHNLTYDLTGTLTLIAGASGTAGKGGKGGLAPSSAYCGTDGPDGTAGSAHDAVHADVLVNHGGVIDSHTGSVQARTVTRTFATVDAGVALLANHFKVNVYYASGWKADHTIDYSMTKLNASTDVGEILRLLHGMEYALQTFGAKAMIDLSYHRNADSPKKVCYYLCKTIVYKRGSSEIYGLTDSGNCVWYSAFTTRKRDSFYSTYYNIMVHEIFHLLYFQASASAQSGMSVSTLGGFNGGVRYYGSTFGGSNDSTGVYDGTDTSAKQAYFLTKYSKLDNREDISETLSIMAIQPQARSFMESDAYIYTKANYLSNLLGAEYACIDAWRPYRWLRYAR